MIDRRRSGLRRLTLTGGGGPAYTASWLENSSGRAAPSIDRLAARFVRQLNQLPYCFFGIVHRYLNDRELLLDRQARPFSIVTRGKRCLCLPVHLQAEAAAFRSAGLFYMGFRGIVAIRSLDCDLPSWARSHLRFLLC
jgi:hypothetical protein